MEDCVFCKIAQKSMPASVEVETDLVIAFQNIHPVAKTHLLITPKQHVNSFMELDNSEVLMEMTKVAQELIKKHSIENGYKLVFNGGKYQAIPHVHWHLLGGELENKNDVLNNT